MSRSSGRGPITHSTMPRCARLPDPEGTAAPPGSGSGPEGHNAPDASSAAAPRGGALILAPCGAPHAVDRADGCLLLAAGCAGLMADRCARLAAEGCSRTSLSATTSSG